MKKRLSAATLRHFFSVWVALTAVASVPCSPASRLPGARHHWGPLAQLHKEKCEKFHFEAGRFGFFFFKVLGFYLFIFHFFTVKVAEHRSR